MSVPIPFSDYSSTLVDADLQRKINLFVHSKMGLRMLPGEVEFSDYSAPSYTGLGSPGSNNAGSRWPVDGDGTKIYHHSGTVVYSNECSTAWNTRLGSIGNEANSGALTGTIRGIYVRSGEAQLFTASNSTIVYRHSMTAGDVTTLSADAGETYDTTTQTADIRDVFFHPDGSKMYVLDQTLGIFQYTVGVAWQLSSGVSYASKNLNTRGGSYAASTAEGMEFSTDGSKVFVVDDNGDQIIEYLMTTPWDVSTAVEITAFDVSSQVTTPTGVTFGNSGTVMQVADVVSASNLYEYAVPGYALSDGSGITGKGRGAIKMKGQLYIVIGPTLYRLSLTGGATNVGTIINDNNPVGLATDDTNLVIAAGTTKYVYTVSGGVATITDTDLGDAYTVAYLDSRFLFDQTAGQFVTTDINDPTSVDPLYFATTEAFGDDVKAVYTHQQLAYLFGEATTEVWYTSGVGQPPLDRQYVIPRGIIGKRAVSSNERRIYILDQDRRPTWIAGNEFGNAAVNAPGLGEEFDSYTTVSDCIVNCYTYEHEFFAEYTFPTQDVTWVYHEASNTWFKREDTSGSRARSAFYGEAYNLLLGVDHSTGKVWKFDNTVYQNNGSNVTRTVDTAVFSSETIGLSDGVEMSLNEVRITSKASGAATLSVSLSKDLATFGTARTMTLASGVNTTSLWVWGKLRQGILRVTTSTNAKIEIMKIEAELEPHSA